MADATIKIRGGAGNAVQIQSRNVDAAAPSDGQALAWSSSDSEWEPTTVGGGSSEWTDTGSVLHPSEETVDNVVVGGTTTANSDIVLGVDGAAVFNEQGADADFRVESDGNASMLFVDGGTDTVGIGTATPGQNLAGSTGDVTGTVLHVKGTSGRGGLVVEGQTGARLDLVDITGGSDTKWMRLDVADNVTKFHSVDDNAAAFNTDNIMVMDLDTGNIGFSDESGDDKITIDGEVALKEQSSAPSATADYSKIYAKEYGNDSNTVLLLTGDGSNDGTTFTDSSSGGTTHTGFGAIGNAHTDTGTVKHGSASMQFDGTGDSVHLSTTHSDFDFGAGDFTVDGWFNFSSVSASMYLFEIGTYTAGLSWLWSNSDYFVTYVSSGTKVITNTTASNNWEPVTGQWYHLALQRRRVSNTTGRMSIFVDGIELCHVTTAAALASITSATHGVAVGSECASPGGTCMNGFIDELRVSNVARYRGNFTPPGSAYPLTGLFTKDSAGTERQLDV